MPVDQSDLVCQSQLFYQFTESQSQKPTSLVTRLPRRSGECGDDEIWPPIHADNRSNAPHNQRQGRRREPQRTASGTEIFSRPAKTALPTPQFLCYKKLKKCLKTIPKKTEPAKNADGTLKPGEKRKLTEEQRAFVKTLNAELQKFNKFFMDAEEDLVIKDSLLEQEYREVVNEDGTRAASFSMKKYRKICQEFADFHGELVLMEHWVGLNYTALVKILKKHDKRSNLSLRSPFLVSVLQQPFYRTEVLSQLITKTETRFRKLNAMLPEGGLPVELQRREEAREHQEESKEESESDSSDGEGDTTQDPWNRTKAAMECWDGLKSSDSCKRPLGDIQSVVASGKRTKQTITE